MKNLSFLLMIAISSGLFAQSPHIEWQKLIGGTQADMGRKINYSHEGGLILFGYSKSGNGDFDDNHGSDDFMVVNTDLEGNINWTKNYGGGNSDIGKEFVLTPDGGYILLGDSRSSGGDISDPLGLDDVWAVKIDGAGNLIWEKSYGGSGEDSGSSIKATPDGNYLIAGLTRSNDGDVTGQHGTNTNDTWILKIDPDGNIIWANCYGGSGSEFPIDVFVTPENEYIITGQSTSTDGDLLGNYGGNDVWLLKLNSSGDIIWSKNYGGSCDEYSRSIRPTSNGYLISSYSCSDNFDVSQNNGEFDYWIFEIDFDGEIIWEKSLGGSDWDVAFSAEPTESGGCIVLGYSKSNDGDISGNYGNYDAWIVELDTNKNLLWEKNLGGSGIERICDFLRLDDSSLLIIGDTGSNDFDITGNNGSYDFWLMKLSLSEMETNEIIKESALSVYPNPSENYIIIDSKTDISSVKIYSMSGQLIMENTVSCEKNIRLNISKLINGNYILITETADGRIHSNKILKK